MFFNCLAKRGQYLVISLKGKSQSAVMSPSYFLTAFAFSSLSKIQLKNVSPVCANKSHTSQFTHCTVEHA